MTKKSSKVFVDDNFHYLDESKRCELGAYESFEASVAACQALVDDYLVRAHNVSDSADDLFDL